MNLSSQLRPLLVLLLWVPVALHGATYYLSPSGSDSNNGTSQSTPWRTIDRLNTVTGSLQPGDRIYFQRGGVYRGEVQVNSSGTAAAPIIVGAYGTGNKPVIAGSELASGWTLHSGQIWKATVGREVKFLFSNGLLQTLARYPNTGWLRNDNGSNTTLYDNALTQAAGHWNNATAVIRSTNWCYELPKVSGFSGSTLTFPPIQFNLGNNDWGYFLCNKLSELDTPGEWYYDTVSGVLYFWAPGGGSPAALSVEASCYEAGIKVQWQRHHVQISDIEFKHQKYAGIHNDGGYSLNVQNCSFIRTHFGIRSYGSNNIHQGNDFLENYAGAALLIENNSQFLSNQLQQIGMVPGLGESAWSYFGVKALGSNNVIRDNTVLGTGYSAIFIQGDGVTVERNIIRDALFMLNDGGAIHFDDVDGLVVRENHIGPVHGDLTSAANTGTASYPIAHGIYFGYLSIKNSLIQNNTVQDCRGAGIHVDHSMVSTGNLIKDNVLFNNNVQLGISDLSNSAGAGASPPYFVANFNDVYSGNLMYCLTKDQHCMHIYNLWSVTPVDFGTFTNNKYYNPYEELSIRVVNMVTGVHERYTLERWQVERGEDAGSTASPQNLNAWSVTNVLSSDLISNGTFQSNVNDWDFWPTNGQLSHSTSYLDNGAMRVHHPNASMYPELYTRSAQVAVQSGNWYRLRFSVQSTGLGEVKAGLKGLSQLSGGNSIHERTYPFSGVRRDVELLFQGNLTDQAMAQFVNHHTEPTYWLDNVQLHRVQVQALDPTLEHIVLENPTNAPQSFTLPSGCWREVEGATFGGTVDVLPYRSRVFYRIDTGPCTTVIPPSTQGNVTARANLRGAWNNSTSQMRTDLRNLNLVPITEPYTAMGFPVANTGAMFSTVAQNRTGSQAVVDWVLLELRNPDGTYSLAERRVALVCRDGEIIAPDGSSVLPFGTTAQGRYLVVRHRNHLGAMTSLPLTANGVLVDFTSLSTSVYGTDALYSDGARRMLWQANAITDHVVRYAGATNDRDPILGFLGGVATSMVSAYSNMDINMDGWVKYSGPGNDRDQVLMVIGGSVLTQVRTEQVP